MLVDRRSTKSMSIGSIPCPEMAACVLRRTLISGLRKVNTSRNHCHISLRFDRLICTSTHLLKKYFTVDHEYLDVSDDQETGSVGITDYAQDKLGDVVYIQLPEVGQALEAGGESGALESVKAASDILSPVTGEVTEVNNKVAESPELVNKDPYGQGWLYKLKLSDVKELETLMDEDGYKAFLKEQE